METRIIVRALFRSRIHLTKSELAALDLASNYSFRNDFLLKAHTLERAIFHSDDGYGSTKLAHDS